MTRPVVSETAEIFYAGLMPWNEADEAQGWPLLNFVAALTLRLTALDNLVRDTDDGPGWSAAVDVNRAPLAVLPWLGQFVGVRVDTSLSEADQREQIRRRQGFQRGTPGALIAAAQPYLTGTKTVILNERDTSAYHFTVSTFSAETPDPAIVEAALRAQKPAGLVMAYQVRDGLTWDEIAASGKTFDELTAEFSTSDAMRFAQSV